MRSKLSRARNLSFQIQRSDTLGVLSFETQVESIIEEVALSAVCGLHIGRMLSN